LVLAWSALVVRAGVAVAVVFVGTPGFAGRALGTGAVVVQFLRSVLVAAGALLLAGRALASAVARPVPVPRRPVAAVGVRTGTAGIRAGTVFLRTVVAGVERGVIAATGTAGDLAGVAALAPGRRVRIPAATVGGRGQAGGLAGGGRLAGSGGIGGVGRLRPVVLGVLGHGAGSLFGRGVRVAGRTCSRVQQVQDHGLQLGDAAAGFVCHGYASADVHAVYGGTAMVGRGAFAGREPAPQAAPWLPPHSAASARARSSRPNGLLSTGSVAK